MRYCPAVPLLPPARARVLQDGFWINGSGSVIHVKHKKHSLKGRCTFIATDNSYHLRFSMDGEVYLAESGYFMTEVRGDRDPVGSYLAFLPRARAYLHTAHQRRLACACASHSQPCPASAALAPALSRALTPLSPRHAQYLHNRITWMGPEGSDDVVWDREKVRVV